MAYFVSHWGYGDCRYNGISSTFSIRIAQFFFCGVPFLIYPMKLLRSRGNYKTTDTIINRLVILIMETNSVSGKSEVIV